jgi:hypothetical protein
MVLHQQVAGSQDAAGGQATRRCAADGCPDPKIRPGQEVGHHSRLGVTVHADCHFARTVNGEDISGYALVWSLAGEVGA